MESIRALFQHYWNLTKDVRRSLVQATVIICIVQAVAVFEPKVIMDMIQEGAGAWHRVLGKAAILMLILIVQSRLMLKKSQLIREAATDTQSTLRERVFERLLRLDGAFHESQNVGLLVGKITRGIDRLTELIFIFSQELWPLVLMFFATLGVVAWTNPHASLIVAPGVVLFIAITLLSKHRMAKTRRERHDLNSDRDEHLGSRIANVRTVWTFGQEERELETHRAMSMRSQELLRIEYGLYDRVDFVRTSCINVCRIGVVLLCIHEESGLHAATTSAFILMVTERLFRACYTIGGVYDRVVEAMDPIERLMELLRAPITIRDPEHPIALPPERCRGEIEIVSLTHAYQGNPPVLQDVNFAIHAGTSVGIVGRSGAGKSTLAKLLMRFIEASTGIIRIDGIPISNMSLHTLRRLIGYVAQENEVFDGSVRENIAYGNPDASLEQVMDAATPANIHEDILAMPKGYETLVGDRGLKLSGGQRQRVSIARMFLLNPPIILLDEATASVDPENDAAIQSSLRTLTQGRTVIVIAHRLSTIQHASRIICFREGRIVEHGTHDELLRRPSGVYKTFWHAHETIGRPMPTTVN